MNVQCSFCHMVFPEDQIERKSVDNMKLLETIMHDPYDKTTIKDGIGEFCPVCKNLHAFGFRKPLPFKIPTKG